MGIFKKALHSKIDVFVKFESDINLEIRGQIKKTLDSFYLGYKDHMYIHNVCTFIEIWVGAV